MTFKEDDIKYEGKTFFVIWNRNLKRFDLCKRRVTHAYVVGHGTDLEGAIRTAKRLELYPNNV